MIFYGKDFGVIGDGVTDDTAAIDAALAAAQPGDTVLLECGIHRISYCLTFKSGVVLAGRVRRYLK